MIVQVLLATLEELAAGRKFYDRQEKTLYCLVVVLFGLCWLVLKASQRDASLTLTLARQAKLDASCRVKVPVGQGLANHPYRVLRVRRSVASGFDCCKCEQGRRSVHREPHRPQGIRTSLKPGQHRYSINTVGDVVNVTEANTRKSPRRDF